MSTPLEISPPLIAHAEEQYHAPFDYLQASNRRKNMALLLMGLFLAGLIAIVATLALALKEKPSYVMAIAPDGEEYIVSTPKKALDLRDELVYKQVLQDLMAFSEAYFERSAVTAQKDYERARWFLPDNLREVYDNTALGQKGWIAGLRNGTVPESHVRIDALELRAADIATEPYRARVYLTHTSPGGDAQHTIATLTFVVRPQLIAKNSRMPLYNALGVFIVTPIEEGPDFRR